MFALCLLLACWLYYKVYAYKKMSVLLFFSTGPRKNTHEEVERLTKEMVDTVEQRNALVEMLEDDRLRYAYSPRG